MYWASIPHCLVKKTILGLSGLPFCKQLLKKRVPPPHPFSKHKEVRILGITKCYLSNVMILCFIVLSANKFERKKTFIKKKIKHFRTIYSNVNVDPNIQRKVGFKINQPTQEIVYLIFV